MAVNPLLALRIGNLLQNLGGQQVQQQLPQESIVNRNPANFGDFLSKIATGIASGNPSSILDPGQFKVNPVMNATDPGMSADLPYDAGARMAQIYQPRTAINDQYTAALGQAPERTSPGALRNIAALIGSSISSPRNPAVAAKLFDESRFGPYYRAQDDYQQKIKNLALGAAEEDRYNTNQRQLAEQTVSREQNQAKIDEAARKNAATEKINQQKLDETKRLNDAKIFRTMHPTWKVAPTKGGTLKYVNPDDPTQVVDTKIPLGTLSDEDRINLTEQNALTNIQARGQIESDIADKRITAASDQQDKRAWSIGIIDDPANPGQKKSVLINSISGQIKDLPVKGTVEKPGTPPKPSTAAGTKELSPTQQAAQKFNRAQQALIEHPEWRSYIDIDPIHKTFTVDPPSSWIPSRPDQKTYSDIATYLNGSSGQQQPSKSVPIQKSIPGINGGIAESTDGGKTWKRVK